MEHASLTSKKASEEQIQRVAEEFLGPFREIAVSRQRLAETEQDLRVLIGKLNSKMDEFTELKTANLLLEREVLEKLNRHPELNR